MKTTTGKRTGASRYLGIAVVEFALVLPILVVLLFGVVELGRIVVTRQILINVSREAANLTSRGTPLNDAIAAVMISAAPLDMATDGYVILTEVQRDGNNNLIIHQQRASGGAPQASRIGSGIGGSATLPSVPTPIPPAGLSLFVAEVFYRTSPITPLSELVDAEIGEFHYDSSFF